MVQSSQCCHREWGKGQVLFISFPLTGTIWEKLGWHSLSHRGLKVVGTKLLALFVTRSGHVTHKRKSRGAVCVYDCVCGWVSDFPAGEGVKGTLRILFLFPSCLEQLQRPHPVTLKKLPGKPEKAPKSPDRAPQNSPFQAELSSQEPSHFQWGGLWLANRILTTKRCLRSSSCRRLRMGLLWGKRIFYCTINATTTAPDDNNHETVWALNFSPRR